MPIRKLVQVKPKIDAETMALSPKNLNLILVVLTICVCLRPKQFVCSESIPLSNILPKIEAIHEDTKSLLIKNVELKNKILAGHQAENNAKIKSVKEGKSISSNKSAISIAATNGAPQAVTSMTKEQKIASFHTTSATVDYDELEEFNKWVELNLEYAVKNTHATAESLKEEASLNNGNVEYSDQAVKDGIEGVKYWQAAVIFQDKTLKNEKFEPQLD